ncbi:uncharacterized protein MYCGRDRAFT_82925 [Zymoseptoria tritici IPO323]|uniref:Invertebrate defensins family profile domain-containing protein n=1 Tax=Zymoseptoria tritici (strain CBS 115943 / IPO323) TaxID=336722 RepID=F9XPA0_ZYMTI|nr:uncharacterized protein MYCGRDRAFT_82925 [Zymoseptoria tritici IPO323]EGP83014.1 hypothetical protein MYCGRDRAFT_82925 [Zymoseptoria tritici IPO323]
MKLTILIAAFIGLIAPISACIEDHCNSYCQSSKQGVGGYCQTDGHCGCRFVDDGDKA